MSEPTQQYKANSLETWENEGLTFIELVKQPYQDCVFAAGVFLGGETVKGHEDNTVYLRMERDGGKDGWMVLLRPDELAAIGYLANSVLWSVLVESDVNQAIVKRVRE